MDMTAVDEILTKIKAYCPYTSNWRVFDTFVEYTENNEKKLIMLNGQTPQEALTELLERIAPSSDKLVEILLEPIDQSGGSDMTIHRIGIRRHMADKAYKESRITEDQYKKICSEIING